MPPQTPKQFQQQHIHLEVAEMELAIDQVTRDPRGIMGVRVCVEKKNGAIYRHGFVGRTLSGEFVVLKLERMVKGLAMTVEAKGN